MKCLAYDEQTACTTLISAEVFVFSIVLETLDLIYNVLCVGFNALLDGFLVESRHLPLHGHCNLLFCITHEFIGM